MPDISCNNPFSFDLGVDALSQRKLLEVFCNKEYLFQTVIFLRGIDVDPISGDDSIPFADQELYVWLREMHNVGKVSWDIGHEDVPVIVKDCSRELADRLRAAVYNRNITALWHNNSLDYFTD